MSKKEKSAKVISEYINAFRCPHCKGKVKVVELKSLICANNHTFDFAKQGYLNLLTHSNQSQYTKELFEARQKIIKESNLYAPLHETITNIMKKHIHSKDFPALIADLGCGEGSHLQRILEKFESKDITGVGLDIAKEGIVLAAKKYDKPIWIVGDLANSPLMDQSYNVLLNILSPSNYKEFKRILVEDGLVIKVVPRTNYLKELRDVLYNQNERKDYTNEKIVALFKNHFQLLDRITVSYSKSLNIEERMNLVQMTPLAWSAEKENIEKFFHRDSDKISIDLDILVGKNVG